MILTKLLYTFYDVLSEFSIYSNSDNYTSKLISNV